MILFESIPAEISAIIISLVGDVGLVIMANVCLTWKTIILKSYHNHLILKIPHLKLMVLCDVLVVLILHL